MISFTEIHSSISEELHEVEMVLKNIGENLSSTSTQEVFNHFYKIKGKYLRPTLVLLSAKAVNNNLTKVQCKLIIELAIAVELIHSASLIHDDIIDGDLMRRGQKTLNNVYGRKIAVLAGDALYARAFSILSRSLPRESEHVITEVIEKMCGAEIDQAREVEVSRDMYLEIIKGKTAYFMSACCRLGASLASAGEEDIAALEEYGLGFGMVYQIIDDCLDSDPNAAKNVTLKDASNFSNCAMASIEKLKPSVHKEGLINLMTYILSFSHSENN